MRTTSPAVHSLPRGLGSVPTVMHEPEGVRRLRRITWNMYHKYFRSGDAVLDLSCAEGQDALELASNGIHVTATDPSAEMIAEVNRKLHGTALRRLITPMQLPLQRLRSLHERQFDGAYSSFGGLNCTNKLQQVASDLAALVREGGHLVFSLLSDFSLWETTSFLVRGKWKQAFRRRSPDGILADLRGERVWVHFYSPHTVKSVFQTHFDFVEMRGLNVFSPPPSAGLAEKLFGRGTRLLHSLDDVLPRNSPLHNWGDQYLIVFKRKVM